MTGAIGLPEDPEEAPLETEGVGEDPGSLPEDNAGSEPAPDSTSTQVDAGNEPAADPTDDDEDLAAGRS